MGDRIPVIAANWKMNMSNQEAVSFLMEFNPLVKAVEGVEILVFPPFTALSECMAAIGSNVKIGAQNMHSEPNGAFTGEISPLMLSSLGVDHVIIGHSERRAYFNETDGSVNQKVISAMENAMTPLICVGESLERRESGQAKQVVEAQLGKALEGVGEPQRLVIAYEPIWAIGTGRTATSAEAQDMHAHIRKVLINKYGDLANQTRIIYGGSVKPDNIKELMAQPDIDGALVGGASLDAQSFAAIVRYDG
ncbi:MAG: triose-phosphate isomerase [archaeon]